MGALPRLKIKDEIRYRKGSQCDELNCYKCVHFTTLEPESMVPYTAKGMCRLIGCRDLARYRVRADYHCDRQEIKQSC